MFQSESLNSVPKFFLLNLLTNKLQDRLRQIYLTRICYSVGNTLVSCVFYSYTLSSTSSCILNNLRDRSMNTPWCLINSISLFPKELGRFDINVTQPLKDFKSFVSYFSRMNNTEYFISISRQSPNRDTFTKRGTIQSSPSRISHSRTMYRTVRGRL